MYKQAVHNVLRQARSMNALYAKSKQGKVDFVTMQKTLEEKEGLLKAAEEGVHRANDMQTVNHAKEASDVLKAEMLGSGMYTQDELAKLSPADLREKMAEVAQSRKVPMADAQTQTREKIVGMRKLEEALSRYVVWDREAGQSKTSPPAKGGALPKHKRSFRDGLSCPYARVLLMCCSNNAVTVCGVPSYCSGTCTAPHNPARTYFPAQ